MNEYLLKLIAENIGRRVTAPQGDGGQCVDLAVLWALKIGLPRVWADAAQWSTQADPHHWQWIANSPINFPAPGSLVVWHEYPLEGITTAGHIAVALLASTSLLLTLDQNFPSGAPVDYRVHTYGGVAGWLRPLSLPTR